MPTPQRIVPCLWYDNEAEEAANFYVSIFPNSRINEITRYGKAGQEIHGRPEGSVLTVEFELDGQRYSALNGGPMFRFSEAISLQVLCETQKEVDYYWDRLTAGGDPAAQQCGWLKDRYGVSWQVVPNLVYEIMRDSNREKVDRALEAMFQMRKLDIAQLKRAFEG